jgi:hypothetical protein
MRASRVSPVHGASRLLLVAKGNVAGKVAAAVKRQRRAPLVALRSWRAARRDGPPPAPAPGERPRYRALFLILCGPGELEELSETIESIERYEGDEVKVLVVEDATPDVRWPDIRARHPEVDVVRAPWPTGGPPRLSPPLARGYRAALERYDFDVMCKIDTDALVTGPGLTERARERFAADPGLGMLGTVGVLPDGTEEDYTYDVWLLEHERRWSRTVRDRVRRAEAGPYDGRKVHGGVYLVSRPALDAVDATGDFDREPPWWSQIGEDTWFTLAVCAAGFRIGSWGAPGEPVGSVSKRLPVPVAEIEERGLLAVHSVRRGARGEPEAVVRAQLRAHRRAPTAS